VGKNVAVFVDVANIFFAAKAAGVDIDYVTLLKSASAGRDLVRAYAYTGLDPENENQRNFHDFLRRHGYKVVSKDIRKYGDGKVKANLDIELVVDMMKTARNLDIAIVVSGDGDFAPAIRAVQEMGVRCEVISFRGNTSSDLIEVADLFTDITQLARVEKGSRSGRRVADDDADLSMTEVPDKQTEGSGAGRGRGGRGSRGRGRPGEAEPVAASSSRGRGRGRAVVAGSNGTRSATDGDAGLVALPGERLSKAGGLTEADLAAAEVFRLDDLGGEEARPAPTGEGAEPLEEDTGRRRRRRGGRGRGRGRGRDESSVETDADADLEASPLAPAAAAPAPSSDVDLDLEEDEEESPDLAPTPPRAPRTTPFGSVWDSQLGTSAASVGASRAPLSDDDEDFDEPEIPEYLIAEQRRGSAARGGRGGQQTGRGGPRGGRSAYQSAMERERYGRGGGGGINRYPDVSGRTGAPSGGAPSGGRGGDRPRPPRDDRGFGRRDERPREAAPRPSSSAEPWSEVPPELEAMLRAQVSNKPAERAPSSTFEPSVAPAGAVDSLEEALTTPVPEPVAPKRRTTRKTASSTAPADAATGDATAGADAEKPAPKRRTTRKAATAEADGAEATAVESAGSEGATPAPKRRTTRAKATAEPVATDGGDAATAAEKPAPKRRAPRKTAASSTPETA
jgi:uncharacterized LabA/DUF88 family protein